MKVLYPDDVKQLSIKLIQALLTKESTRKVMLEKLEIDRSYLSRLLRGERIASLKLCRKIAQVYPDLTAMCMAVQYRKVDL
jgi:transcriptional regulator with XRE-family HTH domain